MLDLSFVVCSEKDAPFSNYGPVVIVLMKYGYTGIKYMGDLDCDYYRKERRTFKGWTSANN